MQHHPRLKPGPRVPAEYRSTIGHLYDMMSEGFRKEEGDWCVLREKYQEKGWELVDM